MHVDIHDELLMLSYVLAREHKFEVEAVECPATPHDTITPAACTLLCEACFEAQEVHKDADKSASTDQRCGRIVWLSRWRSLSFERSATSTQPDPAS